MTAHKVLHYISLFMEDCKDEVLGKNVKLPIELMSSDFLWICVYGMIVSRGVQDEADPCSSWQ